MADDVPPYDCNEPGVEPFPDTVIYRDEFKQLEARCLTVLSELKTILDSAAFNGAVKDALLLEIAKRTPKPLESESEFAIVGEMASGKSSLINSLCGRGVVAKKGDGGASCTWVIHRYRRPFQDQDHPFTARVSFVSKAEVSKLMEDVLLRWHHIDIKDSDGSSQASSDILLQIEDNTDRRDMLNMLHLLFCDQDEFTDTSKISTFLDSAESKNDPVVLDKLVDLAHRLVQQSLDGQTYVELNADTPSNLAKQLRRYTSNMIGHSHACPEPGLWPLTASIDIGIDSVLLNSGITLVDLPGISDANRHRRQLAATQEQACSHQIVVANISRAIDDISLKSNLVKKYHAEGPGYTVLALTRADEIDEATELDFKPAERDALDDLEKERANLRAERTSLIADRRDADRSHRHEFDEQIRDIKLRQILIDQKIATMRQSVRSETVIKAINKEYKGNSGDAKGLPIHAIGNKVYNLWASGFEAEDPPELSLEATGVPGLRQKLLSLPCEARLNRVMHLATQQLPGLLNTLELYCTYSHLEYKAEIRDTLQKARSSVKDQIVNNFVPGLTDLAKRQLLNVVRNGESQWAEQARLLCRRWESRYSNECHLAILKKFGQRSSGRKHKIPVNWNDELINLSTVQIQECCTPFHWAVGNEIDKFVENNVLKTFFETWKLIFKNDRFGLLTLKPFVDNFKRLKEDIRVSTQHTNRQYRKDLSIIFTNLLMWSETAYISAPMNKIYQEVIKIRGGKGAPERRKQRFEQMVTEVGRIWTPVHDHAKEDIDELISTAAQHLRAGVEAAYDKVLVEIDMMCQNQKATDPAVKAQEDELRAELAKAVYEQRTVVGGPVAGHVQFCREYDNCHKAI